MSMEDVPVPLLTQCVGIADALNWLHGNITLNNGNGNVSCVHMDLKPSNILIMKDERSTVGKWKISDFGISVWRNRSAGNNAKVISVGDYVRRGETINTRPKRHEGTYQAPEVKQSESIIHQTSPLDGNQKGIGRKSDVWSFGCIIAEVLAFALGGDQFVKEFGKLRRGNDPETDFFYEEFRDRNSITTAYLTVKPPPTSTFQVRRAVIQWLNELDKDGTSAHRWIQCFVGTIKGILVVDITTRPSSQDVLNLVQHVREHTSSSKAQAFVPCGILSGRSEVQAVSILESHPPPHLAPRAAMPFGQHAYDVPDIVRPTSTSKNSPQSIPVSPSFSAASKFDQNQHPHGDPKGKRLVSGMERSHGVSKSIQPTASEAQDLNKTSAEILQRTKHQPQSQLQNGSQKNRYTGEPPSQLSGVDNLSEDDDIQRDITNAAPSRTGSGSFQPNQPTETPPRTIGLKGSRLPPSKSERSSQLSRNVSVFGYQAPQNLRGLLINPDLLRAIRRKPEVQTITSSSKSFSAKAIAVAVNLLKHESFDVAYLIENTVHLFHADTMQRGISASCEFTLQEGRGWSDISLGGDFVAIWGHLPGIGKLVSHQISCYTSAILTPFA